MLQLSFLLALGSNLPFAIVLPACQGIRHLARDCRRPRHTRRRVVTDHGTRLVAATCRPPSTCPAQLELRKVRLGAVVEGVDVGDAKDVGNGRGGWHHCDNDLYKVLDGKRGVNSLLKIL
jgi:hypothetical protein